MRMVRTFLAGLTAAAVTVGLTLLGSLDAVELGALNHLFELRGARAPSSPIVIVTIDEDSFDELNLPWPFPRALHARLIEQINVGRPLAIGFDVLFPEPSPRGPADDQALGEAVARAGNVVLGAGLTRTMEIIAGLRLDKSDLNPPLPVIRRGAAAVAPVNHVLDQDGHLRRAVLRHRVADDEVNGWDVELYRLAKAAGVPVAPLPGRVEMYINFRGGPRSFPWVPYHRVVNGSVDPAIFRGAIVLVGATTPVLQDVFSTPFARARTMPGVEVHANVLETLIRGDAYRTVPLWAVAGATAAAAFGAAWLAARLRVLRGFVVVVLIALGLAVATFAAFTSGHVWFPAMGTLMALGLGYGLTVIDNYIREQRERRRLSQFFSPTVLREIVRHRADAALGSSRRRLTVLFSDIRGFTSISERVEPEQVVEMLREYLTEMTDVVFRHGGTVDKYIGDCIMALYNVPFEDPDHAANAIRTALELQERALAVAARWEARLGAKIRNGVGINTGDAVVGTMGSRQRLEYTAIGDTVNLASRLEGLTKEYGVGVIISEDTQEAVRGRFLTRQLGVVAVRGKSLPVKIYSVLPHDVRRHPRVAVTVAATVVAVGSDQTCLVRTRDVSEGGLSVEGLPEDWPVGATLQIRCEGGPLPRPIAAEGTIVWRRDGAAGIRFSDVAGEPAPASAGAVGAKHP
jgi:adenylate cyclase